jgi:inorganic pyrophosphatase
LPSRTTLTGIVVPGLICASTAATSSVVATGVLLTDPIWSNVHDLGDIHEAFRAEIEQFFKVYKELEGLPTQTAGFGNRS